MPYFAFRLDLLKFLFQRGKIPDDDLIVLGVSINETKRGSRSFRSGAVITGSELGFPAVPGRRTEIPAMFIGPFEVRPGDEVSVTCSAMNLSDSSNLVDAQKQAALEVKILDIMAGAALAGLGEAAGFSDWMKSSDVLSSLVGGALGAIVDPVGTLLGIAPEGPCNGLVFASGLRFSAEELGRLEFKPDPNFPAFDTFLPDPATIDDSATHDEGKCGHVAVTEIHYAVLRFPTLSVRNWSDLFFDGQLKLKDGLRQFGTPGRTLSLREMFLH